MAKKFENNLLFPTYFEQLLYNCNNKDGTVENKFTNQHSKKKEN